MTKRSLKRYIEKVKVKPDHVNLGGPPAFNNCFNVIKLKNGKWEVFYGRYGLKDHRMVYREEGDAYDGLFRLIELIKRDVESGDKYAYEGHYRDNTIPFQYKFILGIFVTAILLGLFFIIWTLVTNSPIDWMFYFFIGWVAFYLILSFCWVKPERYAKFEYYLTPIMYGIITLFFIFVMLAGFAYEIPLIAKGGDITENIFALIMVEITFGAFAVCLYHFFIQRYIHQLVLAIRRKKTGEAEESPFEEEETPSEE